jgi:hypothetical protein
LGAPPAQQSLQSSNHNALREVFGPHCQIFQQEAKATNAESSTFLAQSLRLVFASILSEFSSGQISRLHYDSDASKLVVSDAKRGVSILFCH